MGHAAVIAGVAGAIMAYAHVGAFKPMRESIAVLLEMTDELAGMVQTLHDTTDHLGEDEEEEKAP